MSWSNYFVHIELTSEQVPIRYDDARLTAEHFYFLSISSKWSLDYHQKKAPGQVKRVVAQQADPVAATRPDLVDGLNRRRQWDGSDWLCKQVHRRWGPWQRPRPGGDQVPAVSRDDSHASAVRKAGWRRGGPRRGSRTVQRDSGLREDVQVYRELLGQHSHVRAS